MRFDILTIFPDFFCSPLSEGMLRRAQADKLVEIGIHNIRDFASDKHSMTDDRPFGGGEGMVMKPEPLAAALEHARKCSGSREGKVVLLSPQGRILDQPRAEQLAKEKSLVLVCGRYEGVDERFCEEYVDLELSVGDYILTGGEPAALLLLDCLVRLQPGVLGCADSIDNETFSGACRGGLKYPQYTRPRVFAGRQVPDILLSGDHAAIARWRFISMVSRTAERRPDLLAGFVFSEAEKSLLRNEGVDISSLTGDCGEPVDG